ncbi:hypothetical protein FB451DRAFT_1406398 [Mycena latifolia]|nr:hypothetical protein FB451DRAFT_1406398 [Mycena latifolia]
MEFTRTYPAALYRTLVRSPHLRHLTVRNRLSSFLPLSVSAAPLLLHLESLSLQQKYDSYDEWELPQLLSAPTLPRLRRLALPGVSTGTVIREFLARSECVLEELALASTAGTGTPCAVWSSPWAPDASGPSSNVFPPLNPYPPSHRSLSPAHCFPMIIKRPIIWETGSALIFSSARGYLTTGHSTFVLEVETSF